MDLTENSHHLFGLIHITMCECYVSLMIIRHKIVRIPEKGQYRIWHFLETVNRKVTRLPGVMLLRVSSVHLLSGVVFSVAL